MGTEERLARAATLGCADWSSTSFSNLGAAKNYFAGAATDGMTTAVAPTGFTLPTFNGLPNKTDSVYGLAYLPPGSHTPPGAFGNPRPVQVAPAEIKLLNPEDLVLSVSTTPVPEPSTWAMMLAGFAGLGYFGYKASRRTRLAAA